MDYRFYCLIATALIFIGYLVYIVARYGVLPSISDSFYHIPKQYYWVFSVFMWTLSIMIMLIGGTNLMYLAGVGLFFVGGEPYFQEKMQGLFHMIAAVCGIMFGLLSMGLDYHMWIIPIGFIVGAGLMKILKIKF